MNKLSRYELAVIAFIFGAVLMSIPLMWNIENLESKIEAMEDDSPPMFGYEP